MPASPAIALRLVTGADSDALLRIIRTPEVARRWGAPGPGFPLTDAPDTVRSTVLVDGQVAGLVQFAEEPDPQYRSASIDIVLDPAHHGQGIGTEVVRRTVGHLIDERGHHRITIDPAADNDVAIACYTKAGFRVVGTMRSYERDADGRGWHDGVLMELLAGDR
jgi:aminoglycoside 6'-N-acetyltransferase